MKLYEIGTIITGNTPSKNNDEYYISDDIMFIKPGDIEEKYITNLERSEGYISEKARNKVRILPKDTVLVTCIGTIGKVGILEKEGTCNQQINAIIPNDMIVSKYLAYLIKSKQKILQLKANAPVVPIINKTDFSKIEINICDIKEQKKIVKKLDLIKKIIDIRQEQLRKLNNIVKSQFVEMFDLEKYKSEELGKICDVRDGTHDSPKYIEKSDYKLITSKNINKEGIDFSDVKYISKKDYDKINIRSNVSYGDILMPMIGTIGNPTIVTIQKEKIDFAIKNVALIKFLNKTLVINKYIKNLINSEWFENKILKNRRGGTQKFISLKDIRKMKIPVPPITLQNQFSEIVKQIDKQKFEIEKSLKEIQELYESLMEKYFD